MARVVPELPAGLVLVDGRMALVRISRLEEEQPTAVVLHPSALLTAVEALFAEVWKRALPLGGAPEDCADTNTSAGREDLVALLLSGLTDAAIARHLGLSRRTVQRRVAELMARSGARTRFQIGIHLARGENGVGDG
ncbi:helix-turn-helix transcriptional regulator [Streptomyces odonnellii]|uniref:helix-turn-helix transcriptional regulator n=1 Tax=Streptomyces odonnellii TaxID=1417980 RepID=UPI000695E843|nr:helix-turn-helix domain-containing protein [Streptomyces odonnellii]